MQKIDPHNSLHYLTIWKQSNLNLSQKNTSLLRQYIDDMQQGINTNGAKKGGRSSIKLLAMARQMQRLLLLIETHFGLSDVTKLSDKQLHDLFYKMTQGQIKRIDGKLYKSVGDYAARFKAFWHWYMKRSKKEGKLIIDITLDLETSKKKQPQFVFFIKEQLDKMLEIADYDTRVFMLFLFDTGIRCPTEAMNIRVCDFVDNYKELDIRDETSKTFGRKIKLMLCSEALRRYVQDMKLQDKDLVFTVQPATMNKRLKDIGKRVIGEQMTKGRKAGKDLTMYDFRHSSACYWLPLYKSRNALLYRFGWRREEEITYYTQLLGMRDTISEEDMLSISTKTELEKEVLSLKEKLKNSVTHEELKKAMAHFLKDKVIGRVSLNK